MIDSMINSSHLAFVTCLATMFWATCSPSLADAPKIPVTTFMYYASSRMDVHFTIEADDRGAPASPSPIDTSFVLESERPSSVDGIISVLRKALLQDDVFRDVSYSDVVHVVDKSLRKAAAYSIDRTVRHFSYNGPLYSLPTSLGGLIAEPLSYPAGGTFGEQMVMDLRSSVAMDVSGETVRSILTIGALRRPGSTWLLWRLDANKRGDETHDEVYFVVPPQPKPDH